MRPYRIVTPSNMKTVAMTSFGVGSKGRRLKDKVNRRV